jgi:hypothetical protein
VTPLDHARVAVAMNTPPQVHVFDHGGTLTATLERRGQGAGEFTTVASVVPLASDSVAAWDADRRRISIFDTNGRFVRELDVSGVAPLSARAAPTSWTLNLSRRGESCAEIRKGGEGRSPLPLAVRSARSLAPIYESSWRNLR